ncbi:response regulator [Pseudochelatococcus lubricantis]|uniref:response regulator n=1 Tax=Pseudochelatococcus lubricantis TaxID=1538102 RepID=UPI0035EDB7EB
MQGALATHKTAASTTAHILVIEDDGDIANMLVELITEGGFQATAVKSGTEMDRFMRRHGVDLIVLDAMLPGEDGFSICRRLRASTITPILMLTALGEDIDRILGLELGADDYVTKPFNSRELLARIKSLLRRASYGNRTSDRPTAMTFAGWRIDPVSRKLHDPQGVEIFMTTAEFDILLAFCANPGEVMTREHLLSLTHAGTAGPVQRSVDVHVSRVRQKIEPNAKEPSLIKTVRLGGYLFTPTVEKA